MTSRLYFLLGALGLSTLAVTRHMSAQAAPARENPFFSASPLFDQAPPFDKIRNEDYQPAFEEGMKRHLAEIDEIANQAAAPTFVNTIEAMERSGALLIRVNKVFGAITSANTNDTLQKVEEEENPKLAAHNDAIHLNAKLFQRVKAVYDQRESLGLTPEQKFLVEHYYREFVRAGALLDEAGKTKLRALNQEETLLSTRFQNHLLAGTKAGGLVIRDKAELDGMSDGEIAAAAEDAKARGVTGGWVIPLQNTTLQPAQVSLRNRAVRERLFQASTQRTEQGDSNDTRELVRHLAQIRSQRAALLGFPTYAAYAMNDQMAKTPEAAVKLLNDLVPPAKAKADREAQAMQALVTSQHGGFALQPWDWQYYAEQVRKQQYALDEAQLKPYFELDRVLHDGIFFAANRLYGLTFKERHDLPVYHPDVRVFEVFDADGSSLALFYCDYFKRDNKNGGAWMDSFVDQNELLGTKAVVFNVANFTKPAPGQPALLAYDDVNTMFHEFGHALHGILAHVRYPTLAGTNVPRDFVEFPSQFNEHWGLDPIVFANYAKHYKTGAVMPAELVEKVKRARTFNQGFATTEYLEASLLDIAWHTLPADAPLQDVDAFEKEALRKSNVEVPLIPPRYRSTYFAHIWSGGYQAGYYAYLWSEVLDDDAYAWFVEHGGLTRENGQRFRDLVLSRGGTAEPGSLFRAFRGRDPIVEPLLEARGLKDSK